MTVAATDIKIYLSGGAVGAGNTDPANSLGGVITATQWPSGIFDNVTSAEATAGDSEYRAVFVKNTNATDTLYSAVVWVYSNTPDTDTEVAIALGDEGKNLAVELIASEGAAPVGPSFSLAATEGAALSLGDLGPGEYYGIWIRRVVNAAASSYANDTFTLRVKGDTASS